MDTVIEISSDEESDNTEVKVNSENRTQILSSDEEAVSQKEEDSAISGKRKPSWLNNDSDESQKKISKVEQKEDSEKENIASKTETNPKKIQREDFTNDPGPSQESIGEVFNEFIAAIMERHDKVTMQKIVDKKLKKYYNTLDPHYQRSEDFRTLLQRKVAELNRSPSLLFVHIEEVVENLKAHLVSDEKTDKWVRKLFKVITLLHKKIKKLEEKEVDWDDEEDSSYLQLQRYRERLVKVHKKIMELQGQSCYLQRKISFSGTKFPDVNRAIEKFINSKGEFPDFQDILDLLKKSYEKNGHPFTQDNIQSEAKRVFVEIGEKLQKRRKVETWEGHSAFVRPEDPDPAEVSSTLKESLEENKKLYGSRIDDFITKYTEKTAEEKARKKASKNSEGTSTEEDSSKKDEEKNESSGEEEEDEDEEEEKGDDDENEDDSSEKEELVEDIVKDIETEAPDDTSMDASNIFSYCGPVSPPSKNDESTGGNIEIRKISDWDDSSSLDDIFAEEEVANTGNQDHLAKGFTPNESSTIVNHISIISASRKESPAKADSTKINNNTTNVRQSVKRKVPVDIICLD